MAATFHNQPTVGEDMTLAKIASVTGFDNAGPIAFYPLNVSSFNMSLTADTLIEKGKKIYIPFKKETLTRMIKAFSGLINDVNMRAQQMMDQEAKRKDELDSFLFKCDLAAAAANLVAGFIMMAKEGAAVAAGKAVENEEVIKAFLDGRASMAATIATTVVPSPTKKPGTDMGWSDYGKLAVRHTLGPWNPSYWGTVYAAIAEDDADIYIYGTDELLYRETVKIANQAKKDVAELQASIAAAGAQLNDDFYTKTL